MNNESKGFSWLGLVALIIILVIVSMIAFLLSSIEGFLAGVVVIFIGFLLSFFRDDLKRFLGLASEEKELVAPVTEETSPLEKIEKKIAKGRKNLAKTKAKYDVETKDKKKQKMEQELLQESTELIAIIDQAKAYAIQQKDAELVQHYEEIAQEVEEIQNMASERLSGQI